MVGEKVKQYRENKGLTINEFSHLSGVSKSYISSIERGLQQNPSIQVLQRLSDALGVELKQILGFNSKSSIQLDEEWLRLVKLAIKEGLTKEEFLEYIQYLQFKRNKVNEG